MKVTLEQASLPEPEVIIRGDIASEQVQNIVGLLSGGQSFQKMFFYGGGREYIFDLKDVVYFEALNNKVTALVGKKHYSVRQRLYELEGMLRPKGFVRINKGTIVNVNYIDSVEAEFSGNYTAFLTQDGIRLSISRKYMSGFRKFIMEEY